MKQIIEWSKGNPGALTVLMSLITPGNEVLGIVILSKLERCASIRGTNIYILWSDLCNKDMNLVAKLCKICPDAILEDACSRQDYSGRGLVAQYLKEDYHEESTESAIS